MGIEDRDWYREQPTKRRPGLAWLIGVLILSAVVFAATSQGRRALGIGSTGERSAQLGKTPLLLGEPPVASDTVASDTVASDKAGLYPARDPWRRYLAD